MKTGFIHILNTIPDFFVAIRLLLYEHKEPPASKMETGGSSIFAHFMNTKACKSNR